MTGKYFSIILISAFAVAALGDVVEYKRERYDVIVDRSPFGEDPLVIQEEANKKKQDAAAAAAAKKMEKQIRLCYLLESDRGEIRAGFQNKAAKAGEPKSYMLTVGESIPNTGMKLETIDLENSSATLTLNGKPVTFELTKAAPTKATAPTAPAAKKAALPQRRFGGGFRRKEPEQPKVPEPQLTPEEQEQRRAEVRERLQNYQEEVIRQGLPALPIQLTQEQDDRLVAEGVLPPVEQPQE